MFAFENLLIGMLMRPIVAVILAVFIKQLFGLKTSIGKVHKSFIDWRLGALIGTWFIYKEGIYDEFTWIVLGMLTYDAFNSYHNWKDKNRKEKKNDPRKTLSKRRKTHKPS